VNLPPAYTVEPLTARVCTNVICHGFHAVASPLPASTAAMQLRFSPPMR
jgi:hypothetical protein